MPDNRVQVRVLTQLARWLDRNATVGGVSRHVQAREELEIWQALEAAEVERAGLPLSAAAVDVRQLGLELSACSRNDTNVN